MSKDLPHPTSGVYRITNIIDGKFYIGSSQSIRVRWNRHKLYLGRGIHPNRYLQNAWNLYGGSSFEFCVITYCEVSLLKDKEQELLDKYWDNCESCYNISKDATCPMRGRHLTEEQLYRMPLRLKGRKQSEEWVANSAKSRTGLKRSAAFCEANSLRQKGMKRPTNHCNSISKATTGEKNPNAKVTEKIVTSIRTDYRLGMTYNQLKNKYDTTYTIARNICLNITWRGSAHE
jgi:group I intron endonuclease